MAIAVLWEFFEFSCDKLLGQSMQQLISVGVDDTMFDLLSATLGGVIGAIWIINLKNLDFFVTYRYILDKLFFFKGEGNGSSSTFKLQFWT